MKQPTSPEQSVAPGGTDAWEHPPKRGPAVFIADLRTLRDHGNMSGGWLDPTQTPQNLETAIEQAVGAVAASQETWVVTDQLDLGPTMIPERLSVAALHRIACAAHDEVRS